MGILVRLRELDQGIRQTELINCFQLYLKMRKNGLLFFSFEFWIEVYWYQFRVDEDSFVMFLSMKYFSRIRVGFK